MNFSISKLAVATGLATGALLSYAGTASAQSVGFKFDTVYSVDESPTGDVLLESIKIGNQIISDFSFVQSAQIIENDEFVGGNTGAASADIGDTATGVEEYEDYGTRNVDAETGGVKAENATADDIVQNLSTNNLNHIIDTEDNGNFVIDLQFGKTIDNLLIWERGKNSDLGIQAVGADGQLLGKRLEITRDMWGDVKDADGNFLKIDTTEIQNAQAVGALGINIFSDLDIESGAVETIRFFSTSKFNGPDWKFVGTDATRSVPEPALLFGLISVGGALVLKKRTEIA